MIPSIYVPNRQVWRDRKQIAIARAEGGGRGVTAYGDKVFWGDEMFWN